GWTSVPWGQDGFFYLSSWKVMYARRGERPVRVLPDAASAYVLSPGPDDSVIVCLARDPKRHIARVWFPADGTYIPLFRAHIGYRPSWSGPALYWSAATGHTHLGGGPRSRTRTCSHSSGSGRGARGTRFRKGDHHPVSLPTSPDPTQTRPGPAPNRPETNPI